jgi:hypothetical protein
MLLDEAYHRWFVCEVDGQGAGCWLGSWRPQLCGTTTVQVGVGWRAVVTWRGGDGGRCGDGYRRSTSQQESAGLLGSASPWGAPSPGVVQAAVWARAESAGLLGSAIM